ncbi:uncharacterized protein [Montipora foliosa]|uniref:uncharacterized protein n=1 Tax=Montipora foliosa TaxID=591990 RepID=UPI0035F17184
MYVLLVSITKWNCVGRRTIQRYGKDSVADALEVCEKSKSIMQQGGFNLRKWKKRSRTVQEATNRSVERVKPAVTTDGEKFISEEDESYAKAATGPPIWNTASDQFKFDFTELSEPAKLLPTTKPSLLKVSARIFDPLGLLSPFTIIWKVLFQELCNKRADWDDQLTEERLKKWNSLILELQTVSRVCIPRCYLSNSSNIKSSELHCFSDASERAYAAVIYLRSMYENGRVDVNLIAPKTKVATLKKQSIPRLELLGATILVRLAKNEQSALPRNLEAVCRAMLHWIRKNKPWRQYVLTRVQEIREDTTQESWNFCYGERNPADIPSRGMNASELVVEKKNGGRAQNFWNGLKIN